MQEYALDLVMWLDRKDQAKQFEERFKLAVVSANPAANVRLMYPEWFPPEEVDADDDLSDTSGQWRFKDVPTPTEAERILAEMIADPVGVLAGDEDDGWR